MKIQDQAETEIKRIVKSLSEINEGILDEFPIESYLKKGISLQPIIRGSFFTKKQKNSFKKITSKYGRSAVVLYHQLALSSFIKNSINHLNNRIFRKEIIKLYYKWFETVLLDFSRQDKKYYDYNNSEFIMDVGVCSLNRIPVGGAWIVEITRASWLPLLPADVVDAFKYFFYLVFHMKGFTPFCIIHTVSRYMLLANEKNMKLAYLNIAKLMKQNPRIKGIYRRSWFLDHKLEGVSPNLTFFRRVPEDNGAAFFSAYTSPGDIQRALIMSSKRRKMHKAGEYVPKTYAYIWPRLKFLKWAEHQESRKEIQ